MAAMPGSYYPATAHPAQPLPTLSEGIRADVCVVGAGLVGCSAALHLAERGYKVVVLEAQRIGWGASGRNGGQAVPGFACGQQRLTRLVGAAAAHRLWDISVEGVELLRERIARHGIQCDLRSGQLQVAIGERQRRELLALQRELQESYGASLQYLDREALQAHVESQRYVAGLLDSGAAHLHPLNYTLGLAAAAREAGALFFEHSPVVAIKAGDPAAVATPAGEVSARFVVLCCSGYIGELLAAADRVAAGPLESAANSLRPRLARLAARIMPVGTYMLATAPLGEARARALLPSEVAVTDSNFVLDYFRRSADHRLLFGGRVSYSGLRADDDGAATRRRMLRVFPQLRDVKVDYAWGGYVDISLNRAPDFGRLGANIYYLQGFSGHGVALAGIAGKVVGEAVAGQAERFDLFARIPHREFFGGRRLRTPALVLGMLWYRMKDLL